LLKLSRIARRSTAIDDDIIELSKYSYCLKSLLFLLSLLLIKIYSVYFIFFRASCRALVEHRAELYAQLRAQLTPKLVREGLREGPYKALYLYADVELITVLGPV
jgi:hypothetical protein